MLKTAHIPNPRHLALHLIGTGLYGLALTVACIVLLVHPQRAPQTCLDALRSADDGFTMASGALQSVSKLDVAGVSYYAGQMNELAPKYNEQKAACRELGR